MKVHKEHQPIDEKFQHMLDHFAHVLPAQATIRDFVHHNTLHGFEHLKFEDALKAANQVTGAYGYWPQQKFREQYLKGRINDADIDSALANDDLLQADEVLCSILSSTDSKNNNKRNITRSDVYRTALIFPLKELTPCQLKWKVEEAHALTQCQPDISAQAKQYLLTSAVDSASDENKSCIREADVISELWAECIKILGLDDEWLHPEQMKELTPQQAEKILQSLNEHELSEENGLSDEERNVLEQQKKAWDELNTLKQKNASTFSLRHLIKTLTGVEVDEKVVKHSNSKIDPLILNTSWQQQHKLFEQVGETLTLRGLLIHLTQVDILKDIIPPLQSYIGSWLDEGLAAWGSQESSFYQYWKQCSVGDKNWLFNDIPDWQEYVDSLPENSANAVAVELIRMDIPEDKWTGYLERLALELPGWSGMFYWRSSNPEFATLTERDDNKHVDMMDYLAVRLIMEHQFVRRLCSKLWLNEGSLSTLRGYFHRHHYEFNVRSTLYNEHIPEYLIGLCQQLIKKQASHVPTSKEWQVLAHMIWTWQQCSKINQSSSCPASSTVDKDTTQSEKQPQQNAWVLFRLAQHLGLSANDLKQLTPTVINNILSCVDTLKDTDKSGFLMLQAYEHHYREQLFSVVVKNHGRGTWENRDSARPDAQIFFCMDDREEGFRRHLEAINPAIETLGAAAFFGVVMEWKALDAKKSVVLCPIVSIPEHEVVEVVSPDEQSKLKKHQQRYSLRTRVREFIHQETQRNLLSSSVMMAVFAPFALLTLLGKIWTPYSFSKAVNKLKHDFDAEVITRVESTRVENTCETDHQTDDSSASLQHGFTIKEQTQIVASFLQNNGLLSGFSNFVVTMGHYSRNQNNPHAAAYGCGACGGKFSGPNGRVFAAMANHVDVRKALAEEGIHIPDDCWFVGGEHDTCNEAIKLDDTDLIPEHLLPAFAKLKTDLALAAKHSAHERCRKLASAPRKPNLKQATEHIAARAVDFSQARPELGHATIAAGFVARRHLSQGTFMDRRCFLISYDASVDPDGKYLERILLSAGPVGAGINLEYYFSSVNNEKYGCGSKIVHNLAGLFGVMEGSTGDLRTGLPLQMVEIHEPMRLQLMVEAKTDTLTAIYQRQPAIQQLVGNGWLLLSVKDPETGKIYTFAPESGWTPWQLPQAADEQTQPPVEKSEDWYSGHYDHLPPVLLKQTAQ